MSKEEAISVVSRALAVLISVWALAEVSYLPEHIQSYVHYMYYETTTSTNLSYLRYMQHIHFTTLAFLVTRLIGYSLLARWLFKGGPDIAELLLPSTHDRAVVADSE